MRYRRAVAHEIDKVLIITGMHRRRPDDVRHSRNAKQTSSSRRVCGYDPTFERSLEYRISNVELEASAAN